MIEETILQQFEDEGFAHIFERKDAPGTLYPVHSHQDKVSVYITHGDVTFDFSGESITVSAGERFDVPFGKEHSATVGPAGCQYIVAEMVKGDS